MGFSAGLNQHRGTFHMHAVYIEDGSLRGTEVLAAPLTNRVVEGRVHLLRRQLVSGSGRPIFLVRPFLDAANHAFSRVTIALYRPSMSYQSCVEAGSMFLCDVSAQRKSCLLLCLAVPAAVSLDALLARAHVDPPSVVTVHVSTGQQISLLLQFVDQDAASRFHERWHGHLFDRSRTEVCHVFYLTTATFVAPLAALPSVRLPMPVLSLEATTATGPSEAPTSENTGALSSSVAQSGCSTGATGSVKDAPAWLPPLHVELPICPVCLERLDTNVSGLVAVPYDDEEEVSRCRVV